MIKYVDNGYMSAGWYYIREGSYYGNGTKEDAERIEKEYQ